MRQETPHQADIALLDMPLLRHALDADAGIVLRRRHEHGRHEIAKVHRRQQLGVERRLVHARLVDELVVEADIAGPLAGHVEPARIVGDVVLEIGGHVDLRQARRVILAMGPGALVEDLE